MRKMTERERYLEEICREADLNDPLEKLAPLIGGIVWILIFLMAGFM